MWPGPVASATMPVAIGQFLPTRSNAWQALLHFEMKEILARVSDSAA
jgi:hypothetical protein